MFWFRSQPLAVFCFQAGLQSAFYSNTFWVFKGDSWIHYKADFWVPQKEISFSLLVHMWSLLSGRIAFKFCPMWPFMNHCPLDLDFLGLTFKFSKFSMECYESSSVLLERKSPRLLTGCFGRCWLVNRLHSYCSTCSGEVGQKAK